MSPNLSLLPPSSSPPAPPAYCPPPCDGGVTAQFVNCGDGNTCPGPAGALFPLVQSSTNPSWYYREFNVSVRQVLNNLGGSSFTGGTMHLRTSKPSVVQTCALPGQGLPSAVDA